jgi:hypothetical protein
LEEEMLKRLCVLALVGVSLVSAKSYRIEILDACKAGTMQLKPGEYTLKLNGSKVHLLDNRGNSVEAPLKVEPTDRKFTQTAVEISGTHQLEFITLSGSKSKVVVE